MIRHLSLLLFGLALQLPALSPAQIESGKTELLTSIKPLSLLFLGDQLGHQPKTRFEILATVLAKKNIRLTYTENVTDLNPNTLNQYDGLILYANIDNIEPEQASALLEYVASGHGFIPIHCATYCFRNSPAVIALMGAQFQKHGTGVMTTEPATVEHPIMKGYSSFTSWDETYVHHLHNESDRIVLEYRRGDMQAKGQAREPWTWVRTQGKGRVFYTAWGHDQRTWNRPGFQNLIERGVRWAVGQDPTEFVSQESTTHHRPDFVPPKMTQLPTNLKPFDYVDVGPKIPNYSSGQGHTLNLMQQPAAPAESMKHMVTPVDFHAELFADETIFTGKPIAMNWDERGRLWVCETVDYPHELSENNRGKDHLRVLTDTDGDGHADESTVFADQLSIPTAIAFHRGGLVVQNGTETLYLKDTDGDDVADERTVLITGWGLKDTHGGVSNFRNGLDNWIWAMQGYNDSAPVINGKAQQSFRQGFFRFKLSQTDPPTVEQLEFVRSTTNNTWGLGISEEGLIFGSTANRAPSFFMPIANRYYERVKGWAPETLQPISDTHLFQPITDKVRQVDHFGGYTAGAGHALYTARRYPTQWWNRTAFVCGPTGKLVGTFVLKPDGAGFRSSNPTNLLASNDEWTAPIMAEVGPDGNVWAIDWYTYIVQHNPTPQGFETGRGAAYATDLREHKLGRVYRVVYGNEKSNSLKSAETSTAKNLSDPATLIQQLSDPTMLNRLTAQRLLIERGQTDIVPELLKLIADQSTDEIGLNVAAIHALQTLKGLHQLDSDSGPIFDAVVTALSHPSAGVRMNAIRVLPPTEKSLVHFVAARTLSDTEPQVILATLLAIADMPENRQAGAAVAAASQSASTISDRWLGDAATSAAANHAGGFLETFLSLHQPLESNSLGLAQRVAEHFARNQPDSATTFLLVNQLALARAESADAVVEGLKAGWPKDYQIKLPATASANLTTIFAHLPDPSKAALLGLAAHWSNDALASEVASIAEKLVVEISSENSSVADRIAAANRLIEFDPQRSESVAAILKQITPLAAPELASGLVRSVSRSSIDDLGSRLIQLNGTATPAIRDALIGVMLSRPALTRRLLTGVSDGELRLSDLTALQRQTLAEHPNARLRKLANDVIRAGGGVVNSDRAKVVAAKMELVKQVGNVAAGKEVFTKNCATCHIYKGEGKTVGPNLTGMSVHPKGELLTHILDPSRSVESNYRLYTVITLDGLIVNGILSSESQTSIEIIDDKATKHTILREDIEALKPTQKSAMPDGLETSVTDQGFVDLLEYLTEKDKFIPIALEKFATVITTRGMFHGPENEQERLVFDDWSAKTVEGVPFLLVDPRGATTNNAVLLHSTNGLIPPQMPKSITLPCRTSAVAIHVLGGVAGWASKTPGEFGTSLIVRLHYADGKTEDHALIDGQHIADYIGLFEVPKSKLAFDLGGRQLRFLTIKPQRDAQIETIELVKPNRSRTAPIVMAITVERESADVAH